MHYCQSTTLWRGSKERISEYKVAVGFVNFFRRTDYLYREAILIYL